MVTFHDPRGEVATEVTPYGLSTPLAEGTKVAFVANGFPDSERFLQLVADELAKITGITALHWNKGNASIPAPAEMLDEILGSCDAAVAAYGH